MPPRPPIIAEQSQRHDLRCMTCGDPLRTQEQHWTHRPDPTVMVDCVNQDCALYMVTASFETYRETAAAFQAAPTTGWQRS